MPPSARRVLGIAACALALAGAALTLAAIAQFVRAGIYQAAEQRDFARAVRQAPSRPAAGAAFGRLEIGRIALSSIVVEGASERELQVAAGHVPGTAFPGEPGNCAIAGHRDTLFRALRLTRKYDEVTMSTRRGEFHYRITSIRIVQPGDTAVLSPTRLETLTLITCYPFYFVGPAPKRFVIQAERQR